MHAIENQMIKNFPSLNVVYIAAEKIINQLINAIKDGTKEQLINIYRNIDTLLIDDIHFIAGKEKIQKVLFNLFDFLYQNQTQIVIASSCSPKNFKDFTQRLKRRFERV